MPQYTFLFTDIQGSTRLWETYPEQMEVALAQHNDILANSIETHGGHIVKSTGDGVFAIFEGGDPLYAALEIQQAFMAASWPAEIGDFLIRVGLHAGQAEPIGSDYYGSDVNRAARVMDAGWGGQILITPDARQMGGLPPDGEVIDAGVHRLKDLAEPIQLFVLTHPDLPVDFPPIRSLSAHPNNLPMQATPFVGRRDDLLDVSQTLLREDCRVVTLLGPGGMGKTRLGLQTGSEQIENFRHGVYFVPLAPVESAEMIVSAIAGSLRFGLSESHETRDQLMQYLSARDMLLILDNFEHVLAGAELVSDIVQHAPGVKVLATSRARLNLSAECVYEVDGLARPHDESVEVFADFEAVELFVTYARRSRPDFMLRDEDRAAVVRICQLVEGMPLGLELAANWISTLAPADIAEELADDIDLLETEHADIPARHRSMRAAFDYSWNLLNAAERDTLAKLAIFRAGCTRDAAKAVAGTSVRTLKGLTNQSLLIHDAEGRYTLHELIRQFAADRLAESGDQDTTRDAHAQYYATFAEREAQNLRGGDQRGALDRCTADFENLRAAWRWVVDQGDEQSATQMIEALFLFCTYRNRVEDGIELFNRARERWDAYEPDAPAIAGRVLVRFSDPSADAIADLEQALALARTHGDGPAEAFCLRYLGLHRAHWSGVDVTAITTGLDLLEESLILYRTLRDRYYEAHVLDDMGFALMIAGQKSRRDDVLEQSLSIRRAIGDRIGVGNNLRAFTAGFTIFEDRIGYINEAYEIAEEMDDPINKAWVALMRAMTYFYAGYLAEARLDTDRALILVDNIVNPAAQLAANIYDIVLETLASGDYQTSLQRLDALFGQNQFWRDQPEMFNFRLIPYGIVLPPLGLFDVLEAEVFPILSNLIGTIGIQILGLPCIAFYIADKGQPERAVSILALALTHPERTTHWADHWEYVTEFKAKMRETLGDEAYERAWVAGTRFDPKTIIYETMEALGYGDNS